MILALLVLIFSLVPLTMSKESEGPPIVLSTDEYDLRLLDHSKSCSVLKLPPKPLCKPSIDSYGVSSPILVNLWKTSDDLLTTKAILVTFFKVNTSCSVTFWGNKIRGIVGSSSYYPVDVEIIDLDKIREIMTYRSYMEKYNTEPYVCNWNSQTFTEVKLTRYQVIDLSYTKAGVITQPPNFNCEVSSSKPCRNSLGQLLLYKPVVDLMDCPYDISFQAPGLLQVSKSERKIVIIIPSKKLLFWFPGQDPKELSPWCIDIKGKRTLYKDSTGYLLSWENPNLMSNSTRPRRSTFNLSTWFASTTSFQVYMRDKDRFLTSKKRGKRHSLQATLFKQGMTELQRDWGTAQLQWAVSELITMLEKDIRVIMHSICTDNLKSWNKIWDNDVIKKEALISYLTDEPGASIVQPPGKSALLCIPLLLPAGTGVKINEPLLWVSGTLGVEYEGSYMFLHPYTGVLTKEPPNAHVEGIESFLVPLKSGCSVNLQTLELHCDPFSIHTSINRSNFLFDLRPLYSTDELFRLSKIWNGNPMDQRKAAFEVPPSRTSMSFSNLNWTSFFSPVATWFESLTPNVYWLLVVIIASMTIIKVLILIIHGALIKKLHIKTKDLEEDNNEHARLI